eukprot:CAMPEP_0119362434 /NCGR_PEP_ID=MMETSP1334-20130426/9499_1 /TAXON_ID=127549 /ORGANISM="Calcidiscus leptoporus, Strain RCC1130" /LENGTH=728 /DNA_ID=CAMNT_0007377651 /DNA_START=103 /DNA_END=2289 /DNA_ORIENTATION=+
MSFEAYAAASEAAELVSARDAIADELRASRVNLRITSAKLEQATAQCEAHEMNAAVMLAQLRTSEALLEDERKAALAERQLHAIVLAGAMAACARRQVATLTEAEKRNEASLEQAAADKATDSESANAERAGAVAAALALAAHEKAQALQQAANSAIEAETYLREVASHEAALREVASHAEEQALAFGASAAAHEAEKEELAALAAEHLAAAEARARAEMSALRTELEVAQKRLLAYEQQELMADADQAVLVEKPDEAFDSSSAGTTPHVRKPRSADPSTPRADADGRLGGSAGGKGGYRFRPPTMTEPVRVTWRPKASGAAGGSRDLLASPRGTLPSRVPASAPSSPRGSRGPLQRGFEPVVRTLPMEVNQKLLAEVARADGLRPPTAGAREQPPDEAADGAELTRAEQAGEPHCALSPIKDIGGDEGGDGHKDDAGECSGGNDAGGGDGNGDSGSGAAVAVEAMEGGGGAGGGGDAAATASREKLSREQPRLGHSLRGPRRDWQLQYTQMQDELADQPPDPPDGVAIPMDETKVDGEPRASRRSFPPSLFSQLSHRLGLLVLLLIFQSISSFILARFEALLFEHGFIVAFLTMLVGSGGNAGNQAAVLVIRALATGELNRRTILKYLLGECKVALSLGVILTAIGFARVVIFDYTAIEGAAVAASLFVIVVISVLAGSTLPLALHRIHLDPAHAGATIQVIMDLIGVFVTCWVTYLFFEVWMLADP